MSAYRDFQNIDVFRNISEKESDGFLIFIRSRISFLWNETSGCNHMEIRDPDAVLETIYVDLSVTLNFKFNKIQSEHGNYKRGQLVFYYPLSCQVKDILGVKMVAAKYTLKFQRSEYESFCESFMSCLLPTTIPDYSSESCHGSFGNGSV
jgi:hypothetical protein